MSYSSTNTIATVAKREIHVALRNKAIIFSIVLTLVLALAGIGLFSWLADRDTAPTSVAVVGITAPTGTTDVDLRFEEASDRDEARAAVEQDEHDAALVPAGTGWELLTDGSASSTVLGAATQLVTARATSAALAEFDVSAEDFGAALPSTDVVAVDISAGATSGDDTFPAVVTVFFGVAILIFSVMLFAGNIGGRVTEEKSSRVVEIILASVRPMDFLAGKILGNVIFGFLATTAIVVLAGAALAWSGLLDGIELDWTIVPVLLIGFVLGMVFFGSLYAAAGALVQRSEDIQSTQTPIMILLIATVYVAAFGFTSLDATWMQVLAWVPPISVAVAPLQYAAGNFGVWELTASFAILAVAALAAIWVVARIYRNAILNNGRKMTWRQALLRR